LKFLDDVFFSIMFLFSFLLHVENYLDGEGRHEFFD